MKRETLLWIVIGVLFVFALVLVFQAGATGTVQTAGSTAGSVASNPAAQMVGGC